HPRALAREVERRMAPAQRIARRMRSGVGQDGEHEGLGVPEGVPVVARSGQALRRDRALLCARPRLKRVEERKAKRLLQLDVAVELDVGAIPEVIEIRSLVLQEPIPAGMPGLRQRGAYLVAERLHRAPA